MALKKAAFSLFVFISLYKECYSQEDCTDCMRASGCPAARILLDRRNQESITKLKSSFCGFKDNLPNVCCSRLDDEELDNHPNLSLLPSNCGLNDKNRIVGGMEAGLYQFPWMVLISYRTRLDELVFACGGTLISDRYVLTAAHCIKSQNIAGVRIGEHDITSKTDCQGKPPQVICETSIQDKRVEEAIMHPDYRGKPNVVNDVGLLRLQSPVDFKPKNADAICLPVTSSLRQVNLGGVKATVAGWGHTENRQSSSKLLTVDIPVYTIGDCRQLYNRGATAMTEDNTLRKLCAGSPGKDSCNGDSGGPLMVTGTHNGVSRFIQYGIVSYGPRQCGSQYPGVYTDVTKHMKWILDTIRQ